MVSEHLRDQVKPSLDETQNSTLLIAAIPGVACAWIKVRAFLGTIAPSVGEVITTLSVFGTGVGVGGTGVGVGGTGVGVEIGVADGEGVGVG